MRKQDIIKINLFARWASTASAIIAGFAISSVAVAQNSSVIVDLSVIEDGGKSYLSATRTMIGNEIYNGNLLMPGSKPPKSTYYGPPLSTEALDTVEPILVLSSPAPSTSLKESDEVAAPESAPLPEAPAITAPETASIEPAETEAIALVPQTEVEPPDLPEPVAETSPETATTSDTQETGTAAEVNIASATPGVMLLEPGRAMQVIYAQATSDIPAASEDALNMVAEAIIADENLRIQLMAYAGDNNLSSSKARRLSLSRALSVRSFFIGQGVRSTRIDVRALGDKTKETPVNRVDINITER